MTTDVSINNSAFLLIGADEINSFTDGSREARIAASLYETTKLSELQRHDWVFTRQQALLARTTDTPLFDYQYAYQIPSNSLKIIATDVLPNQYTIQQDKLFSDVSTIRVIHQVDPSEVEYPAYFRRLLEYKLAEVYATALLQDETMSTVYSRKYQDQFFQAKTIDAQQEPTAEIPFQFFQIASVRSIGSTN